MRSAPTPLSFDHLLSETWRAHLAIWGAGRHALHMGYWDASARDHARSLDRMREVMADLVEVRAGERVLDLGCGVGGSALWLARERGASVVGVDLHARPLQLAQRYAARSPEASRVSFVIGDLRDTGLDDERFDIVWAQESVEQVAEHDQVLAEAFRVLRPGGRLIVENIFSVAARQAAPDLHLIEAFQRGCRTPVPSDQSLAETARAVGFVEVALQDITPNAAPSFKRMHQLQRLTRPLFELLDTLGLRTEQQRDMRHGLSMRRAAFTRGLLLLGLLTARKPGPRSPADSTGGG